MGSGRWASLPAVILLASATKTSDSNSTPVELGNKGTACLDLEVTAAAGTDEVQSLIVDATGGTFTLTYSGQTTAAIDFDATAAEIQAALEALSNIAVGDVTCAGGPVNTTPVTITFGGTLDHRNVAAITSNAGSLTGGASTATMATDTAGVDATLAVTVKTCKTADGTFRTVDSFTTVACTDLDAGPATQRKSFTGLDRFVRVDWDLTGAGGSFTFSVTGEAKLHRAHQAPAPL